MSTLVMDVCNDYFQILQTFYVKLVALHYESMPSFRFFEQICDSFYFKFISVEKSIKSQKIAWKLKIYIFTWNVLVRLKVTCCTKMK
jgi:hypothetical protein